MAGSQSYNFLEAITEHSEVEITDFSGFCYISTLGASEISPIGNEQFDAPESEFIQKVMQRKTEVQ